MGTADENLKKMAKLTEDTRNLLKPAFKAATSQADFVRNRGIFANLGYQMFSLAELGIGTKKGEKFTFLEKLARTEASKPDKNERRFESFPPSYNYRQLMKIEPLRTTFTESRKLTVATMT